MTLWPDASEHNLQPVNRRMTRHYFAFRVNDGTYPDRLFRSNWAGRWTCPNLLGFLTYMVHPRSMGYCPWQQTYQTFVDLIGPGYHPRMAVMMDVESWSRGDLQLDHSQELERLRRALVHWLFLSRPAWQRRPVVASLYRARDERRVIGYGNRGDLMVMASGVQWKSIILADYSHNPTPRSLGRWNVIGRQYTDHGIQAPWGHVDMNYTKLSPRRFALALGLGLPVQRLAKAPATRQVVRSAK